jgi:spore maturation protein CgeB
VVVTDHQADLERCFEPGREVLAWLDLDQLNAMHARLIADPDYAADIGQAGRRRVLAEHTYSRRLEALAAMI